MYNGDRVTMKVWDAPFPPRSYSLRFYHYYFTFSSFKSSKFQKGNLVLRTANGCLGVLIEREKAEKRNIRFESCFIPMLCTLHIVPFLGRNCYDCKTGHIL